MLFSGLLCGKILVSVLLKTQGIENIFTDHFIPSPTYVVVQYFNYLLLLYHKLVIFIVTDLYCPLLFTYVLSLSTSLLISLLTIFFLHFTPSGFNFIFLEGKHFSSSCIENLLIYSQFLIALKNLNLPICYIFSIAYII